MTYLQWPGLQHLLTRNRTAVLPDPRGAGVVWELRWPLAAGTSAAIGHVMAGLVLRVVRRHPLFGDQSVRITVAAEDQTLLFTMETPPGRDAEIAAALETLPVLVAGGGPDADKERKRVLQMARRAHLDSETRVRAALIRSVFGEHGRMRLVPEPEDLEASGSSVSTLATSPPVLWDGKVAVVSGRICEPRNLMDLIGNRDEDQPTPVAPSPSQQAGAPVEHEGVEGKVRLRWLSPACPVGSPQYAPLQLAVVALGGCVSSRLVTRLRMTGLSYLPTAMLTDYASAPGTYIEVTSHTGTRDAVRSAVVQAVMEVAAMSQEELDLARTYMIARTVEDLGGLRQRAKTLADNRRHGRPWDWPELYCRNLAEVELSAVHDAARTHLLPAMFHQYTF